MKMPSSAQIDLFAAAWEFLAQLPQKIRLKVLAKTVNETPPRRSATISTMQNPNLPYGQSPLLENEAHALAALRSVNGGN